MKSRCGYQRHPLSSSMVIVSVHRQRPSTASIDKAASMEIRTIIPAGKKR